jgi:hypothetical protein
MIKGDCDTLFKKKLLEKSTSNRDIPLEKVSPLPV